MLKVTSKCVKVEPGSRLNSGKALLLLLLAMG